jgi:predicted peroxiredoxin
VSKILINCNHGTEDAERATLPFVVANVAATADQETIVFLTVEGVRLATKGYADGIHKEGMPAAGEVIRQFSACTKPRGITDADLIEGAKIVTAANVVEEVAGGALPMSV